MDKVRRRKDKGGLESTQDSNPPLWPMQLLPRCSGGEILHAGYEQRLVFLAWHVLERAVTVALGVAHLAEHAAVRAGDAFDGQQ